MRTASVASAAAGFASAHRRIVRRTEGQRTREEKRDRGRRNNGLPTLPPFFHPCPPLTFIPLIVSYHSSPPSFLSLRFIRLHNLLGTLSLHPCALASPRPCVALSPLPLACSLLFHFDFSYYGAGRAQPTRRGDRTWPLPRLASSRPTGWDEAGSGRRRTPAVQDAQPREAPD